MINFLENFQCSKLSWPRTCFILKTPAPLPTQYTSYLTSWKKETWQWISFILLTSKLVENLHSLVGASMHVIIVMQ